MVKKGEEIFELICISYPEYMPNDLIEFTLGYYSTQEKAIEQKEICEREAEEFNQDLQYEVKKHRIIE